MWVNAMVVQIALLVVSVTGGFFGGAILGLGLFGSRVCLRERFVAIGMGLAFCTFSVIGMATAIKY